MANKFKYNCENAELQNKVETKPLRMHNVQVSGNTPDAPDSLLGQLLRAEKLSRSIFDKTVRINDTIHDGGDRGGCGVEEDNQPPRGLSEIITTINQLNEVILDTLQRVQNSLS